MNKLSVVLPAYNEELMVGKTCRVLAQVLTEAQIPYELVVVNDGSSDRTWEEIQKAWREGCQCDRRCFFPEILGKKQRFLPDLPRLAAMWWQ